MREALKGFDTTGEKSAFPKNCGCVFRGVPETLLRDDGFQLVEPDLFGSQVKDSLRVG